MKPNVTNASSVQPTKDTSPLRNEQLKTQLEQINKMLFDQIKQKIAAELARQQREFVPSQPPVVEKPATVNTPPKTQLNDAQKEIISQSAKPAAAPVQVELKSSSSQSIVQPQLKPKVERAVIKTEIPNHWEKTEVPKQSPVKIPEAKIEQNNDQFRSQINHLEIEIKVLVKEVEDLDKTVKSLEAEKTNTELTSLERRIEVDQKMLAAIADWRLALNNLINSHSIAIKYLKEKTDWLEEQTTHEAKHNKFHHKPIELSATLVNQLPQASAPIKVVPPTTAAPIQAPPPIEPQLTTIQEKPTVVIAPEAPLVPETKAAITPNQEAAKQQLPNTVEPLQPVVEKSTQTPNQEAIEAMIQQALAKQKQQLENKQSSQADPNQVKDLVKDALKSELPKVAPTANQTVNTVYVKEVDKSAVIPDNAQTGVVIKEQVIGADTPVINISSADIEKQILEQAEKEEAVKEAIRQAKEKAEHKIQEERAKKEQAVSEAAKQASNTQLKISEPTQEMIKAEVDKLKASLTTIDNKQLKDLSKEQRTDMIRKLENLEKETVITKQFDEIKSATERRRINNELSSMLHQIGQKPAEPAPANQNTAQRMQTLKVEEKKQTTPAQKAHLIAEIKELERQSQARKAADRARPTVKAQPAFGKMLPNTPTVPNVINGIVKDPKGLLLSTVVIIVKDSKGDPVRAFKTNKIGQFALSTPVPNGVYTLELEKDGYEFDIIEVDVNGAIMQPIEIKAR